MGAIFSTTKSTLVSQRAKSTVASEHAFNTDAITSYIVGFLPLEEKLAIVSTNKCFSKSCTHELEFVLNYNIENESWNKLDQTTLETMRAGTLSIIIGKGQGNCMKFS